MGNNCQTVRNGDTTQRQRLPSASIQQTRHIDTILGQCWVSVADGGPTLSQHCIHVSYLLGIAIAR